MKACFYRDGRAKGYAFVYVAKAGDVDKVIEHLQGKRLMARDLQAKKYSEPEARGDGERPQYSRERSYNNRDGGERQQRDGGDRQRSGDRDSSYGRGGERDGGFRGGDRDGGSGRSRY